MYVVYVYMWVGVYEPMCTQVGQSMAFCFLYYSMPHFCNAFYYFELCIFVRLYMDTCMSISYVIRKIYL